MQARFRSLIAVCGLMLSFCAAGFAQQGPPAAKTTPNPNDSVDSQTTQLQGSRPVMTLQANSRAVLLDVVVTDSKGHVVKGLKAKDFEIFEDGQPQKTASLEEHRPINDAERAKLPKAPKLAPNTFSNLKPPADGDTSIVLLIDAIDTPVIEQMVVRKQLLSYIASLKRGPEVAIFQLDSRLHMIQGFTSDPEVLKTAVKRRERAMFSPVPEGQGYTMQAFRMDGLTSGLETLGGYLKTRPGRKNLIWFTARIPRVAYDNGSGLGGSFEDRESFIFDYTPATDALVLGQIAVYPVDARGLRVNPIYSAAQAGVPNMAQIGNFDIANASQHVDLNEVADVTGGKAFYNNNDMKGIVAQVVEAGGNYYTLSYYPSNKVWDGSFRKLKVVLDKPGHQLQYRRGYYAQMESVAVGPTLRRTPVRQVDGTGRTRLTNLVGQDRFSQAMELDAVDPADIIFQAQVTPAQAVEKLGKDEPLPKDNYLEEQYRGMPFRNYKVSYRVEGNQLQLAKQPDGLYQGNVELVTLVFDDMGAPVNTLKITLDMSLKQTTYKRLSGGGFELPVMIAVPTKGDYFLRMGVHDVAARKAGAIEVSLGDIQMGAVSR